MIPRLFPLLLLLLCTPAKSQTVTLVSPIGNERYSFNDTLDILWSGIGATVPVKIELSNNGGQTFTTIAESATGNLYRWPVSGQSGDRFRVRVTTSAFSQVARVFGDHLPRQWVMKYSPAAIHPSGDTVVSTHLDLATDEALLKTWGAFTGDSVTTHTYKPKRVAVASVQYQPDGDTILAAMTDGKILLWHAPGFWPAGIVPAYTSEIDMAVFSPDGRQFATIGDDYEDATTDIVPGVIKVWDVRGGLQNIRRQHERGWTIEYSPDGRYLVTSSERGKVRILDAITLDSIATLDVGVYLQCATFSPDQKLVAAGDYNGNITLFDVESRSVHSVLRGHKKPVVAVAFSPDGRYLVSGSHDSTARIWDLESETSIITLTGSNSYVPTATFTARGQVLTGSFHTTARLWDISVPWSDTSSTNFTIDAPQPRVRDIDFGRVLVGARRDSTLDAAVCNETTEPIRLREITFIGDGASDFSLRGSLNFPVTIAAGECQALDFDFSPSSVASRSVQVRYVIDDDTLYAEFRGEGVSTLGVDLTGASGLSLRAVPNPASVIAVLEYTLARPGDVDLRLVDARGSVRWQQRKEGVGTGTQRVSVDLAGIASGQYWLLLQSGDATLRRQLIIIK